MYHTLIDLHEIFPQCIHNGPDSCHVTKTQI